LLKNYLDDGSIDYLIHDILKQWEFLISKHGIKASLGIRKEVTDYNYLDLPITKALFDENILLYHKYNKQVQLEQHIYIKFLKFYLKGKYDKKFTVLQRFYGVYYSAIKAYKFSNDGINIGRYRRILYIMYPPWEFTGKLKYHGYNLKWDVPHELYKGNLESEYEILGIHYKNIY
jgi:hypothetical protein